MNSDGEKGPDSFICETAEPILIFLVSEFPKKKEGTCNDSHRHQKYFF